MALELRLPRAQSKGTIFVLNPETCPECGRQWKRVNAQDKSTECEECRAYLDDERDNAR